MKMFWPVQAHTNLDHMVSDKIAPLLIDQCAIGLEGVENAHPLCIALLSYTKSVLVERYGQDERLACMPDDGDRIGKPRLAEKPFKGARERLLGDALCGGSVRKIAIATVDITKGRGLNDNQLGPCSCGVKHLFPPCLPNTKSMLDGLVCRIWLSLIFTALSLNTCVF